MRLTDSGLGCPDWPTCANHHIVAAWQYHAVVEFTNRVFTVVVSVAVALVVLGALVRVPRRRDLVGLSLGLVLGMVAQIVLGGLVVLFKLSPALVMCHFMLSLAVLWNSLVLYRRADQVALPPVPTVGRDLIWLGRLVFGTVAAVIALGTAVTGSGPHSGGTDASRLPIPFHSMAELHASVVMLLIGITLATLFGLHQARAPVAVQRRARVVFGVMLAQGAIGYTQYFTRVPVLLVGFHIAGATLLWIATVWFYLGLFSRYQVGEAPSPADVEAVRTLERV